MAPSAEGMFSLRSPRWCVFVSGRGSNLSAVLESSVADIRLVISSSSKAPALAKARRAGVPTFVIPRKTLSSGKTSLDWAAVNIELERHSVELVFLLGFMHVIPKGLVEQWSGKILNVHPSILPKFSGLESIARAVAAKDDCGVTVHEVSEIVDAGNIVSQRMSVMASQFQTRDELSSQQAELLVHIDEQRLVRHAIEKWRSL